MNWLPLLYKARFSLAAFTIPLIIRAIPEILAGAYPIGWDIIAYYLPNAMDWARGSMSVWNVITSPPLMYAIVVPVYLLTKASLFLIFKIMGPILLGGLTWSTFQFCKRGLLWPERKALLGVLFVASYFVILRISWDAYQLELGLTLFLLSLSIGHVAQTARSTIAQAMLLSLAVLSNQLVGVLVVGFAASFIFRRFWKGTREPFATQFPAITLFLLTIYATSKTSLGSGFSVLGTNLAFPNLASNVAFLFYAHLFIIPLVLVGLKLAEKSVFTPWVLVCMAGLGLSALPGYVFQDIGYRWVLVLSIPILLVAFQGFSRLTTLGAYPELGRWVRLVRVLTVIGLATSASLYIVLPAQLASPYFAAFPQYIPTSMAQSSVSQSDYQNVADAMVWVNTHLNADSVLITHQAFYGWARTYLSPDKQIVSSYLSSPTSSVGQVDTYAHVFTVWWVKGTGWFVDAFPTGSTPIDTFGDIAVYQYR